MGKKNVCKMSLGENGIKINDDVRLRVDLILDGFRMALARLMLSGADWMM